MVSKAVVLFCPSNRYLSRVQVPTNFLTNAFRSQEAINNSIPSMINKGFFTILLCLFGEKLVLFSYLTLFIYNCEVSFRSCTWSLVKLNMVYFLSTGWDTVRVS